MDELGKAVQILDSSGVVGMPTETVYGLAARIDRPAGIAAIFSTKKRPFFDPLIVHVHSVEQAKSCVKEWGPIADLLVREFWPGPLTLVLPKSSAISDTITSGLDTVGIRCPDHPVALQLLRMCQVPLAAPSANRFGHTSPTSADHVRSEFGEEVFVIEGGPSAIGLESTIVLVQGHQLSILRPGMLTHEQIERPLDHHSIQYEWIPVAKPIAPGQMKHHYMPNKPLLIFFQNQDDATVLQTAQTILQNLPNQVEGVQIVKPKQIRSLQRLELSQDPTVAARELYGELRKLAQKSTDLIVLDWSIEKTKGDWSAIWDRLSKAASWIESPKP